MKQNIPLGITLLLLFTVLAPIADGFAKLATANVMLWVIIIWRFVGQVTILGVVLAIRGDWEFPYRRDAMLLALRGALHVLSMSLLVAALRAMPLADATAIAFILPFLMLAGGHFLLGETIERYQIYCSLAGFIGVLLVLQPNLINIGWHALFPLGVAFAFAAFQTLTRFLSSGYSPYAMQFYGGLSSLGLFVPFVILTSHSPSLEFAASFDVWYFLLGMTLTATLAHVLLSGSLTYAPQSVLAPLQYIELPFVILIGFLFFGDVPVPMALVGIVIIAGAGLYASGVGPRVLRAAQRDRHLV